MTANDMMTLRALLEKSSDADLLREMIGFTDERLMALEIEGLTGAATDAHSGSRPVAEVVFAPVDEIPDMMLAETATHLEDEHGLRVSQSTVWRFFHRRGITFKKNGARHRATELKCRFTVSLGSWSRSGVETL